MLIKVRNDLKVSLYHLFLLRNRIHDCLKSLNDLTKIDEGMPKSSSRTIRHSTMNYIDITTVGYLDEFDRHTGPILKKLNQAELLKNIKDVRQEIEKKWPDLKIYRNDVLAHHFREKSHKSLFDNPKLKEYRVPNKLKDKVLFSAMIGKITALIGGAYPDVFLYFMANKTAAK